MLFIYFLIKLFINDTSSSLKKKSKEKYKKFKWIDIKYYVGYRFKNKK